MKLATCGGIDYGAGTNANHGEKARYGVVPLNDLSEWSVEDVLFGQNSTDLDWEDFIESFRCSVGAAVDDWLECSDAPDIGTVLADALCDYSQTLATQVTEIAIEEIELAELPTDNEVIKRIIDRCVDECQLGDYYESQGDSRRARYDDGEIVCQSASDGDLWVLKSPFVTWAQFCSPVASGAGYLRTPCVEGAGAKCYCLPHDWWPDGKCPYPYWNVNTGEKVFTPSETTED